MDDASTPGQKRDRAQRQIDYLRRRSRHRLWWSSAQIAMRRGEKGEPAPPPKVPASFGRRV